jgi:small-conductance mechanosensitive channel
MVIVYWIALQSGSPGTGLDSVNLDPEAFLYAGVVLLGAYVTGRAVSIGLTALGDRLLANRFRVTVLVPLVKFLVYGSAIYVVLSLLFELSSTQLVAFSGLLGAALGLGLKDLLADVVGGLVLVAEQPYQIGDKIRIGEHYGEVVDIGIRSTQIVTPNDTLVSVPNYYFFNESIANASAGRAEMLVTVEFYIDPGSDARLARRIVEDALLSSQYVYVDDECPVEVHIADGLHYRTITGRAYVNDLRNELRFKTDVTDRVFEEFGRRAISSPKEPEGPEPEAEV